MLLNDRYLIQDTIGHGHLTIMYRGMDTHTDQSVAIKVLREDYSKDPKFIIRFQKEAEMISSLQHPNIVQVYDYGQMDITYFMIMERIEGTDLRRYMRSRGIVDTETAVNIAYNVALGLGAAHRRDIVHRNLKPQNILISRGFSSIKITDFSSASVYGMKQYYSPEQTQGEIVGPTADVYSLGIVMYEMMSGHTPFDGADPEEVAMQHIQDIPKLPSQLNPAIPTAFEEIIMRCLEKSPDMRYRDGSQLAHALEALM